MRRILLRAGKSPFEVVSTQQAIQQDLIGTNAGNLIFSDAAYKMLLTANTEIETYGFKVNPNDAGWINEKYDVFVIPLANAFRPSFEGTLKRMTTLIERLKIPVVILGVGAQTYLNYRLERLRPINDSVRKFCKAVLDRSPSIGVRGECTENYLHSLGFRDVEVIGCPSMFWHGDQLRVEKKVPFLTRSSKLAISASRSAMSTGAVGNIVATSQDRYPNLLYIAQELKDLELLYWGDVSAAANSYSSMPLYRTHRLFRNNQVRVFLDPITWIKALAQRDFAFGTRIHGNVAALLAGTPSVVLCHDSRTLELCQYFDIPHRLLTEVPLDVDPAELYDKADYSALMSGHKARFERMVSFLDRHGLDHIYGPTGDNGASFEARMRLIDFPPPVAAWNGEDDGGFGYRFSWLKTNVTKLNEAHAKSVKRIAELEKQNAKLAKRLKALERGSLNGTYLRTRRAVGRPVRRILKNLN